jgi:hypothetical protein
MAEHDSQMSFIMPGHFGAPMDARITGCYHDVTAMVVAYLTDREEAQQQSVRGRPSASTSEI